MFVEVNAGIQSNKSWAIYEFTFAPTVTLSGCLFTNEGVESAECGIIMNGSDL